MALFHDSAIVGASGNQGGAGEYQISRSLRFNSSDSAYLSQSASRSPAANTSITFSFWLKLSDLSTDQQIIWSHPAAGYLTIAYYGGYQNGGLWVTNDSSGADNNSAKSNGVLRDPSAWYHVLYSRAHGSNGILYINGVQQTTQAINTANIDFFADSSRAIGRRSDNNSRYASYYLADFYCIDGQALTPSSFTEVSATTGQLIPKAYTGSFGTNGFWLKFSDNSAATATTLGKDYSGNSNNWTPNNLSVTAGSGNDSLVDTPTSYGTDTGAGGEVRGNYATFNLLASVQQKPTVTDGNLKAVSASGTQAHYLPSTVAVNSGKWYAEFTIDSGTAAIIGAVPLNCNFGSGYLGSGAGNGSGYATHGYAFNYDNAGGIESSLTTATTGDIIGVALDLDDSTGKLFIYKNGSKIANAQSDDSFTTYNLKAVSQFWTISIGNNATWGITANFGQRPFAYTAPSGFKALCDTNLPAPVVAKPSTVMDVALWTGDGVNNRQITGLNFSPDLVWVKSRSQPYDALIFDAVRGSGISLTPSSTSSETTNNPNGYVSALSSSGFTLTQGGVSIVSVNQNTTTYAAWTWDAGSSTVTNTSGSISSQVRANASAGFSIVTYTGNGTVGATVGHGLGVAPAMLIVKRRDAASGARWAVQHTSLAATQLLALNTTAAAHTESAGAGSTFNVTKAGSSVFTLGDYQDSNANTGTYVAYCFAPVAGYSAFGSYTGNGSSDGPFVYTGFRPKWIMVKQYDTSGTSWIIYDAVRDTYNAVTASLYPNSSTQELGAGGTARVDFLSNGFKLRSSSEPNWGGASVIWAAFAESPFVYSRAR